MRTKSACRAGDCYRRSRLFSLVEIMIVVVIMGMLIGLVAPNMMKQLGKAQQKTAKTQIKILSDASRQYFLDLSEYPSKLEDLVTSPGNSKWDGPYLDPPQIPLDPWGQSYNYSCPGANADFDISSYGADRQAGGEGKNADIVSWEQ